MATHKDGGDSKGSQELLKENMSESDGPNMSTLDDNHSTDGSGVDMEFYEDCPTSNQPNVSVPHKVVDGVEYAVAQGKSQVIVSKEYEKHDKESGNDQKLLGIHITKHLIFYMLH